MIVSFLAPKGGVGSSTLAVLTAVCKAQTARVLVLDAAQDPSLDLYTSTENSVAEPFNGNLSHSAEAVRGLDQLLTARIEPEMLPDKTILSEQLDGEGFAELIIDFGTVGHENLSKVIELSDEILVVLTQDNQVLRAADRLLGEIRRRGGRAGFIINHLENRDIRELGDAQEIYGLLEEDCYGGLRYDHSLRFTMNQGKPAEVSQEMAEEIQTICDKIYRVPAWTDDELREAEEDESDAQRGSDTDLAAGFNTDFETKIKKVSFAGLEADSETDSETDSGRDFEADSKTVSEAGSKSANEIPGSIAGRTTGIRESAAEKTTVQEATIPEREGILSRIRSFFRIGKG